MFVGLIFFIDLLSIDVGVLSLASFFIVFDISLAIVFVVLFLYVLII